MPPTEVRLHGEWAWNDDRKHVAAAMEDDEQFTLCSACGVAYPDGGMEASDE